MEIPKIWKAICKFEHLNPEYIFHQMNGLLVKAEEYAKEDWRDGKYTKEKVEYAVNNLRWALESVERRIQDKELAAEFVRIYNEEGE